MRRMKSTAFVVACLILSAGRLAAEQTAKRDLETGRSFVVSNEKVGHAQCMLIERTANRDAKFAEASPAKILDGGEKPSAKNGRVHLVDLSNSARVIARSGRPALR